MSLDFLPLPEKLRALLFSLRERLAKLSLTLRVRIMGLVAVSVLIPAILTGWMADGFLNRDLQRELYSNSKIRNERLAARVTAWFDDLVGRVRAATNSPYLFSEQVTKLAKGSKGGDVAKAQADLDRYLTYLVEDNPNFQGFAILTEQGSPLAVWPHSIRPFLGGLVSERTGDAASVLEVNTVAGKKVFILQRVGGIERERTVYLAGLLRTEALVKVMAEGITEGGLAYLVDAQGAVKQATTPEAASKSLPTGAAGILKTGVDAMTYRGLLGGDVIGSASKIDDIEWWVVSETSRREALENMARFRQGIVYVTLAIAGLLLLPALLVARTIVLPLEELSRAAQRIRSGEAGLTVQTRIGGELGDFIQGFNSMSRSLQMSMEEIRAANNQLRVISITDPLTGRYNRRFMETQLTRSLKLAERGGAHLSVVMLDLDHFKRFNDAYGHLAGDEALKQVGDLMVSCVRETDFVSRFGGEEFLVILDGTARDDAGGVAEKIRVAVENHIFDLGNAQTRITASLGVASYPEDGATSKPLLEAADRALYKAKDQGRNRVCLA